MADLPEEPFEDVQTVEEPENNVEEPEQPEQPANNEEPEEPSEELPQEPSDGPEQPENNEEPEEEPEEQPSEEPSVDQRFQELSDLTGLELSSYDDVLENLNIAAQAKKDPLGYAGVSPSIKAAIEAEQKGIPPQKFFSVSSIDPDKLGEKDLLRQNYMLNNPDDDQEFLHMSFEREYDQKYGILNEEKSEDDFDSPQEYQKYLNDKKFAEKMLANESSKAKQNIGQWKEKALTPEKQGPSEEEQQRMDRAYAMETDRVMSKFNNLQVKMGENDTYNFKLNDEDKQAIRSRIENLTDFFKEIGVDSENQKIDQQKLAEFIGFYTLRDKLSDKIATHKVENKNRETVTSKLQNKGGKQQGIKHQEGQFLDELDEAATLFAQKR